MAARPPRSFHDIWSISMCVDWVIVRAMRGHRRPTFVLFYTIVDHGGPAVYLAPGRLCAWTLTVMWGWGCLVFFGEQPSRSWLWVSVVLCLAGVCAGQFHPGQRAPGRIQKKTRPSLAS